jgi:hypothetical protein
MTLRVPPDLRNRIYAHKEFTGMSVNGTVLALVEDSLNRIDADAEHDRQAGAQ